LGRGREEERGGEPEERRKGDLLEVDGLLGVLELVVEVGEGRGLLAAGRLDDSARAADDLAGDALLVELAEASPLADELALRDADEGDATLGAEGLDELDVGSLVAVLGEDTEDGLATVESSNSLFN
jgi:hypothetical protein